MEKQISAVEWLVDMLDIDKNDSSTKDVIQQAKAMEKEQMHKCASFWRGKENEIEKPIFEQYYNETFKSEFKDVNSEIITDINLDENDIKKINDYVQNETFKSE